MAAAKQTLLVVGGNGFLGSAVARAAVARGWTVHSLSRSGRAPSMPDGSLPAFTSKVQYHAGSAFDPSSYADLIGRSTAVVHSLGILLEGVDYKSTLRGGGLVGGLLGLGGNPLERRGGGGGGGGKGGEGATYELMNRDSALAVLDTVLTSRPSSSARQEPLPFVYVSAEDVFRPFVDRRYIDTKREAEEAILAAAAAAAAATGEAQDGAGEALETLSVEERLVERAAVTAGVEGKAEVKRPIRPIIVRPGIMTSTLYRPLLAPLAPLLGLSSALPPILPSLVRSLAPRGAHGAGGSFARLLENPALDVDEVGEAVCRAIESRAREGVIGIEAIRRLAREGSVIKENAV